MKESDEEEALVAEENWGQSIADAGGYMHKGKMSVWARSDMDEMCLWGVGRGNIGEIEVRFSLLDIPLYKPRLILDGSCKTTSTMPLQNSSSRHSRLPRQDPVLHRRLLTSSNQRRHTNPIIS